MLLRCAGSWTAVEEKIRQLLDEMINVCRHRWKAYLCLVRGLGGYCTPERRRDFEHEWDRLELPTATTPPTDSREARDEL